VTGLREVGIREELKGVSAKWSFGRLELGSESSCASVGYLCLIERVRPCRGWLNWSNLH